MLKLALSRIPIFYRCFTYSLVGAFSKGNSTTDFLAGSIVGVRVSKRAEKDSLKVRRTNLRDPSSHTSLLLPIYQAVPSISGGFGQVLEEFSRLELGCYPLAVSQFPAQAQRYSLWLLLTSVCYAHLAHSCCWSLLEPSLCFLDYITA
jgi:hypothetical protein